MNLKDAKILISGSSGSLGNSIVKELLPKVKTVIGFDIKKDDIDESEKENYFPIEVDITDYNSLDHKVEHLFKDFGGCNVCINCAGIIHSEPLVNIAAIEGKQRHSVQSWNNVINVNLNTVFNLSSLIAHHWVKRREKGILINISSIAAKGNAGQSAYAASKAAVEALTKVWSKELGMFGIRVACIAPGFINTSSTNASLSESMVSKWKKSVPLNRFGDVSEIVSAVQFIIENDYFNGKILSIDGGLVL